MNDFNGKRVAVAFLCLSISSTLFAGCVNNSYKINKATSSVGYNINKPMSNEELLNEFKSIYSSSEDMQKYWGCIYNELCDFILNDGQYLDQVQLLSTLPSLKFETVPNGSATGDVLAGYNPNTNKISYLDRYFSKSPEQQKEITLHEAFHYFFFQQFSLSSSSSRYKGNALDEGTASLFTREYEAYVGVDAYTKNSYYVKAICELIGSDKYLTALGHHDYSELVGYLSEYANKNQVEKLIGYIDTACRDTAINIDADKKAMELLEAMYLKKHNITVEESNDNVMKHYFNKLFDTDYSIEGARSAYQAHVNKNYFVNTDMTPNIVFSRYGQEYGIVYLNDKNEVESGKVLAEGYYDENNNVVDSHGEKIDEEIITYTR